jgi:hypothetical protein
MRPIWKERAMALKPVRTTHTGEERWERELRYEGAELDQVRRLTDVGRIAPEVVHLVWTRRVGESWRRVTAYRDGSRIEGHERLDPTAEQMGAVGRWGYREIFTRERGNLRDWADRYPGLRTAIDNCEAELPG